MTSRERKVTSRQHGGLPESQEGIATEAVTGRDGLDYLAMGEELSPGERLHGYEVIRLLGRGGMGTVYAARDTKLGRRVAIKRVAGADSELTVRFLLEARATARCSHENIVVIHEVNEEGGHPFMVLEYIEGRTLSQVSSSSGTLSVGEALELVIPVVRALAHAHGLGIVHRDLKPDNVMLTAGGTIKVLDFGIAKAFAGSGPEAPVGLRGRSGLNLTGADVAVGTPPYMSPEQLRGEDVDGRSDLWAVGVMLYELLVGHHPLGVELTRELIFSVKDRTEGSLSDLATSPRGIPQYLASIIAQCLAYKAEERFSGAPELLFALEGTLPQASGESLSNDTCPYPGLAAFETAQASLFFGRDEEIRRIRSRLRDEPMVVLVGPSGSGKSSLVSAGVVPSLKAIGEAWEVFAVRPGSAPLDRLAALAEGLDTARQDTCDVRRRLSEEPGYLGSILRRRAVQQGGQTLLCVDQLEELYTVCDSIEERRTFAACILAIADDVSSPARVIATMRSDLIDRASETPHFFDRLARGLVLVPPLDRIGLRSALLRPAELTGYTFEDDELVETMLDELETASGGLPLLQFAAGKLWDSRDLAEKTFTNAGYRAMGGLAGALATHADHVLAEVPSRARSTARSIFQRLVTADRTRSTASVEELLASTSDREGAKELIDRFVASRLLVVDTNVDDPTLEIVHESLITRWPTLARWLSEAAEDVAFLDQLRGAAKQWEDRGRSPGLLWRESAMEEARQWRVRNPAADLPINELCYLDAVFALELRDTRRRRRARIGAVLLAAAVSTGAVTALVWVNRSESDARATAEHARDQAERALRAERQTREEQERSARERTRTVEERKLREEAETTARTASAQVEETQEDLKLSNAELQVALTAKEQEALRARVAREKAERETARAQTAERSLAARHTQLKKLLTDKEQRVQQLEKQMRSISTDLK